MSSDATTTPPPAKRRPKHAAKAKAPPAKAPPAKPKPPPAPPPPAPPPAKRRLPTAAEFKALVDQEFLKNGTFGRLLIEGLPTAKQQLDDDLERWSWHISGRWPLSAQALLDLRADVNQLLKIINPNAQSISAGYSHDEREILKNEQKARIRSGNELAIRAAGPVIAGAPFVAQLLRAPNELVTWLGEANANAVMVAEGLSKDISVDPIQPDPAVEGMRKAESANESPSGGAEGPAKAGEPASHPAEDQPGPETADAADADPDSAEPEAPVKGTRVQPKPLRDRPFNRLKQNGHSRGTREYENRIKMGKKTSSFESRAEADKLTLEAWEKGKPVHGNPRVKELDFGRPIGEGPEGGTQHIVRVTQDDYGSIHGSPIGPVTPGH